MNNASKLDRVLSIAKETGWVFIRKEPWCFVFAATDNKSGINVYWNSKNDSFTVQTWLTHPKKGRTQLNRRDIELHQLKQIFENPRTHTGKGYYRK